MTQKGPYRQPHELPAPPMQFVTEPEDAADEGSCRTMPDSATRPRCDMTCTVDCGRCKGNPIWALKREIRLAAAFSRDAHGGVPFDDKPRWQQGHAEAVRAVARVLSEF